MNCGARVEVVKKEKENKTYYDTIVVESHSAKKPSRLKIRFAVLFFLFFIIYNVVAIAMNYIIFGSLEFYLPIVFWYIPCWILFFFPYQTLYRYYCKKNSKFMKPLPNWLTLLFRTIGALLIVAIHIKIGWVLAFTNIIE